MAGKKEIPREISIWINDKEVVNSFAGINRAIASTNNEIKNLNKNSATYDEDLKKLQSTLGGLKEKQAEFKKEINDTSVTASQAKESISKIFLGLTSGNLTLAKEGLEGVNGSIKGMIKSAWEFIATPLGAAIAVLAGFAMGAKAIFDFNVEAEKSTVLIENLSGKTGQAVEDIRVKMQAMTDTFGLSFDQLAKAVDNLVDTGVAKDELEALDKIKNGLLTAPDKNEFLGSLESTAAVAKQLGMKLEDVIALKQSIETKGVEPDAVFGALEKATQRLSIGADGLRKKMSDALGAGFTDDVLAKVTTGQISITKALDLINTKSLEVGLNQTQQAELGKELFGKGAIAAGGYANVLDTVAQSIKNQQAPLNENQKALDELEKANLKVATAQSELFRVKDFGSIWTSIKASATDALGSILEWIIDVKKDTQPLIDLIAVIFVNAWHALKTNVQVVFDVIGGVLKIFSNSISTIFNFWKKIIHGDFSGALDVLKNGFTNLGNIVGNTFAKIKNHVIDGLKAIVENVAPFLDAIGIDVDKIQKKLDSFKSKEVKLKTTSESGGSSNDNPEKANTKATEEELAKQKALRDAAHQKEIEAHQKELDKKKAAQEKHDKEIFEKAIGLAKAKADLAKAELDYFISNNRSKLDGVKELTPDIIAEETKRLQEIKFQQENALAEKRLSDIAAAEKSAKSAEELADLKKAIDLEYLTAQQNLEYSFLQSTDAMKKQYAEQQKQLAAEQLQAENELELLEADTKLQQEAIKQRQDYQAQLLRYKQLLESKKITQAQYDRFAEAAKKQQDALDKQRTINQVQGALGALGQLAGALGQMFGQSKELAIAQAAISGAQAILSIWQAPASLPQPYDSILKGILTAGMVVQTATQIGQIKKQKAPATPKFFYGGPTGDTPFMGHDEHGPVTGVVHSNEWVAPAVMTQSPKYAATFAWLENERRGAIGKKFASGGETTPGTIPPYMDSGNNANNEILNALNKLNGHLDRGIKSQTVIGYQEAKDIQKLNDERTISNNYATVNQ